MHASRAAAPADASGPEAQKCSHMSRPGPISARPKSPPSYERIAFLASPNAEAKAAHEGLSKRYGNAAPESADVIVPLGGDGFMLQTLHRFMTSGKPIYGMHRGTVGFLMNEYSPDDLQGRLAAARNTVIHPLLMCARD